MPIFKSVFLKKKYKKKTHPYFVLLALRVHCSETCAMLLNKVGGYKLEERGIVYVKVSILFFSIDKTLFDAANSRC